MFSYEIHRSTYADEIMPLMVSRRAANSLYGVLFYFTQWNNFSILLKGGESAFNQLTNYIETNFRKRPLYYLKGLLYPAFKKLGRLTDFHHIILWLQQSCHLKLIIIVNCICYFFNFCYVDMDICGDLFQDGHSLFDNITLEPTGIVITLTSD